MGNRLSKIITRTGDQGTTGLANNTRVPKTDLRIIAMGDIDELNSHIGLLKSLIATYSSHTHIQARYGSPLSFIQHRLFDLGGELSLPGYIFIQEQHIQPLETEVNEMNQQLTPLKEFILPGGHITASQCHVARTVCRRAERSCIALHQQDPINSHSLIFMNRLSDWLFTFARILNKENDTSEVFWQKE
jgi:cob(I)alamin adenosyltransferase